jgi:hypothetical protein
LIPTSTTLYDEHRSPETDYAEPSGDVCTRLQTVAISIASCSTIGAQVINTLSISGMVHGDSTATNTVGSYSSVAPSKPTATKFTPVEITDHRVKGLCFRCDEKFTPGYKEECKCLFVIEVLEDKEETVDPMISLHALMGI